jgi:hypothetical protein
MKRKRHKRIPGTVLFVPRLHVTVRVQVPPHGWLHVLQLPNRQVASVITTGNDDVSTHA